MRSPCQTLAHQVQQGLLDPLHVRAPEHVEVVIDREQSEGQVPRKEERSATDGTATLS